MFMFAILFGLSMDYNVFPLSRMREEYLRTGDARGAVIRAVDRPAVMIAPAVLNLARRPRVAAAAVADRLLPHVDLEGRPRLKPAPEGQSL